MSLIPPSSPRVQRGRTLLELLIAIAIGLVILLALGTVYLATTSTNRQSTSVSRMSEDAAVAFNLMGSGLRMAGYSAPRALVLPGGAMFGGVKVVAPDRNFVGAAVRGCDHGFVDGTVAFESLACGTDTALPAAVAIRFEGDAFNTVPITVSGTVHPSDCLNNAVTDALATASAIDPARKYRLIDSRFTAQVSTTSGTPELFCGGNGGGFTPQPLMQFIDSVQLRYGVAADGTSRDVTHYATAAEVDALPGSTDDRWARVVNIKLCMVMRSQARDQAGAGNYIDCDGTSTASADGFARRAFTSFYALRNRSGFLTP